MRQDAVKRLKWLRIGRITIIIFSVLAFVAVLTWVTVMYSLYNRRSGGKDFTRSQYYQTYIYFVGLIFLVIFLVMAIVNSVLLNQIWKYRQCYRSAASSISS